MLVLLAHIGQNMLLCLCSPKKKHATFKVNRCEVWYVSDSDPLMPSQNVDE